MMKIIIDKLNGFFEFLRQNGNIEIVPHLTNQDVLEIPEVLLRKLVGNLKEASDIGITEEDWPIFTMTGLSICWRFTNAQNQFLYGGFELASIDNALREESEFWKTDFSLPPDSPVPVKFREYVKLNWFERQAWGAGGDRRFGCFYRNAGAFPSPIYFYDRGAFCPLPLDFTEYFDAMIASCAVRGWQYFYIAPAQFRKLGTLKIEALKLSSILYEMEYSLQMLSDLFPNCGFSHHQRHYNLLAQTMRDGG